MRGQPSQDAWRPQRRRCAISQVSVSTSDIMDHARAVPKQQFAALPPCLAVVVRLQRQMKPECIVEVGELGGGKLTDTM